MKVETKHILYCIIYTKFYAKVLEVRLVVIFREKEKVVTRREDVRGDSGVHVLI